MPRPVRLRLLLLLVAASNTDELTEAKKQQLIRDGGLTPDAHLLANLEHVTRRAGSVQRYSTASAQSGRSTSASASNAATNEDSFLKHACMLMETANRKRTLRVGLSLASVQRDHAMRPNGASGGQNSGAGDNAGPFQGCGGKWENHPDLGGGGGGGTIVLTTPQRILLLVLGGVACSERRSVHEISKRYSREVVIGEASMPRPESFVCRDLAPYGSRTWGRDTHRNASRAKEWNRCNHTRLRVSVGIVCSSFCIHFPSKKRFIRYACVCFNGCAARLLLLYSWVCGCGPFPCN
ncbi:putative syntaxin binding protein [Trypanosoma cruzi]|nr:putative syntaxin binding protein [Trypanosoma cruzi]